MAFQRRVDKRVKHCCKIVILPKGIKGYNTGRMVNDKWLEQINVLDTKGHIAIREGG